MTTIEVPTTPESIEERLLKEVAGGRSDPRDLIMALRDSISEPLIRRAIVSLLQAQRLRLDEQAHLALVP